MSKRTYVARAGYNLAEADAQEIGEFIYDKCRGLTTEEILNKIEENPESRIYQLLEWDNNKAAKEYRLEQVRWYARSVTLEITSIGSSTPTRCFFNVKKNKDSSKRTWEDTSTVFNDAYMRNQIVEKAKHELEMWEERYNAYKELASVIKPIRRFLKK